MKASRYPGRFFFERQFRKNPRKITFQANDQKHNFLITIIATVGGIYVESIYTIMIQSWVSLLVIVFIPVTAALYSKKADSRCIWATMLTGIFVWLAYIFWCGFAYKEGFSDDMLNRGAMYGFAAALISFFVYTFCSQNQS